MTSRIITRRLKHTHLAKRSLVVRRRETINRSLNWPKGYVRRQPRICIVASDAYSVDRRSIGTLVLAASFGVLLSIAAGDRRRGRTECLGFPLHLYAKRRQSEPPSLTTIA